MPGFRSQLAAAGVSPVPRRPSTRSPERHTRTKIGAAFVRPRAHRKRAGTSGRSRRSASDSGALPENGDDGGDVDDGGEKKAGGCKQEGANSRYLRERERRDVFRAREPHSHTRTHAHTHGP